MKRLPTAGVWIAIAIGGAIALGKIALYRGEAISATWFVVAAICCYLVAYRLYSAFISAKLLALDDTRATPAERLDDGNVMVNCGLRVRRMRAGFYYSVLFDSAKRKNARRNGAR